jgi:anhydro-N-acetylmuramic acid kinase
MNLAKKFQFNWQTRIGLGVMTGTSCDGIDIAAVEFSEEDFSKFTILKYKTYGYPKEVNEFINNVNSNKASISDISQFNYYISQLYAEAINKFMNEFNFAEKIDFVAVHGQTIWHQPVKTEFMKKNIASTYQAINLSALSKLIGLPVVGDFRAGDIALGGNGAPLVPMFDYALLSKYNSNYIVLNIGGISNLTLIPQNAKISDIVAFDCGPGNILINLLANKYYNLPYDNNGEIAKSGKVNSMLLDIIRDYDNYCELPFPKSTGREHYNQEFIDNVLKVFNDNNSAILKNDIISTFSYYTALCIADSIEKLGISAFKLIISGGGLNNTFMIDSIKNELLLRNQEFIIENIEHYGINSDAKEAIAFAYLGYLFLNQEFGNVPSATGAESQAVLGTIAF